MFTPHPLDALLLAEQHGRRLRAEAAVPRFRGASPFRSAVATSLRRLADRLDPGALVRQPAR